MIWSTVPEIVECERLKLVIMDHYCPFTPPPIKNLKIEKNCWTYHHFTHVYQKPELYEVQFLRYGGTYNLLPFWVIFLPFYSPNNPKNQNFEKMKKSPRDNIILQFVLLLVLPSPLTTWKINVLKKWKKVWRYYHSAHV